MALLDFAAAAASHRRGLAELRSQKPAPQPPPFDSSRQHAVPGVHRSSQSTARVEEKGGPGVWRSEVVDYWSRWGDQVLLADSEFLAKGLSDWGDDSEGVQLVPIGAEDASTWWSALQVPGSDGDGVAADLLDRLGALVRVRRIGRCAEVEGGEPGFWRRRAGGFATYHLRDCIMRRFDRDTARACLNGRHLLLIGDSVMRYQYASLVFTLLHSWPEGSGVPWSLRGHKFRKGGTPPPLEEGGDMNVCVPIARWEEYHLRLSAMLGGSEWCDCFRSEEHSIAETLENRYFSLHPDADVFVTFMNVMGHHEMHGHFPGPCRLQSKSTTSCSLLNMTKWALADARAILTASDFHGNDVRPRKKGFDWKGPIHFVLDSVVPNMNVDVLVFNTGIWAEFDDRSFLRELTSAGNAAVFDWRAENVEAHADHQCDQSGAACRAFDSEGRGVQKAERGCFWRRTTSRFSCPPQTPQCDRTMWIKKELGDVIAMEEAARNGWGPVDTGTMTSYLEQDAHLDAAHYRPYVYNEINNLMLNKICRSP
mmetsp:Transcript_60183/g.160025  ORF Transcript_60183/g.160025 Transcript_60183/m.160025 type:complete len:537 (+) Transcript_60183:1703-3313(+)